MAIVLLTHVATHHDAPGVSCVWNANSDDVHYSTCGSEGHDRCMPARCHSSTDDGHQASAAKSAPAVVQSFACPIPRVRCIHQMLSLCACLQFFLSGCLLNMPSTLLFRQGQACNDGTSPLTSATLLWQLIPSIRYAFSSSGGEDCGEGCGKGRGEASWPLPSPCRISANMPLSCPLCVSVEFLLCLPDLFFGRDCEMS